MKRSKRFIEGAVVFLSGTAFPILATLDAILLWMLVRDLLARRFLSMLTLSIGVYVAYYLRDRRTKGGERALQDQSWLWKHAADYFPVSIVRYPRLNEDQFQGANFLLGYHPHGLIPMGAALCFGFCQSLYARLVFPRHCIRLATLSLNVRVPLWRELVLANGLMSVEHQNCFDYLMGTEKSGDGGGPPCNNPDTNPKQPRVLVIAVGGARESLYSKHESINLVINRRNGFFRMALQTGYPTMSLSFSSSSFLVDRPSSRSSVLAKTRYFPSTRSACFFRSCSSRCAAAPGPFILAGSTLACSRAGFPSGLPLGTP